MNGKRIIFHVSDDFHKDIKIRAFQQGLTITEYLTQIIKFKFERDDKKS